MGRRGIAQHRAELDGIGPGGMLILDVLGWDEVNFKEIGGDAEADVLETQAWVGPAIFVIHAITRRKSKRSELLPVRTSCRHCKFPFASIIGVPLFQQHKTRSTS